MQPYPVFPVYTLRVAGHLPQRLLSDLEGVEAEWLPGGETRLTATLTDASALYGLLDRLRDLNVRLLELRAVTKE